MAIFFTYFWPDEIGVQLSQSGRGVTMVRAYYPFPSDLVLNGHTLLDPES